MDHEVVFSVAGALAMVGWATLLASPFLPRWSDRIAGVGIPALLAAGYVGIAVASPAESGGFDTFAAVTELFSQPGALLAGWVHYLAFDLVVGAWICRAARDRGIRFRWVLPCLPLTFLLGPAGFLLFTVVLGVHRWRRSSAS